VRRVDPQRLLDGLNDAQRRAVTAPSGLVVVLAGAGSGKTRVLTRRIGYRVATGEVDARRILALTFTRKAAGELRSRLRRLGLRDDVVAGTFHGVALTQLRQRWAERQVTPPTILDRKYRLVSQLLGRQRGVEPLDVVAEIEWARARLVDPEDYGAEAAAAGRTPPVPPEQLGDLLVRYQSEKRRRRLVDFDDLLALAARDLESEPDYAAAVRWRHRHLFVDEFQDVNPLQHRLLEAWRGDRDDLFVVGDPNQAIYGWNGADAELLTGLRQRPAASVIRLVDNYRSTPQVLAAAAALIDDPAQRLRACQPDGPLPVISGHPTDTAESAAVAAVIRSCKSVTDPWSHQAVLARTNAQLVPIEQALVAAGIPCRVRGGAGPLSTPEVRDEIRSLVRPGTDVGLTLAALDERLAEPDEALPATELERRANLGALSRVAHEYLVVDPDPSGPGLAAWLATLSAAEVDTDDDAVELTTFHGAKGLEWPVVHVTGLETGFVPISYARTGAQRAEERRLLYVALTRAERELHLTWSSARTFGAATRRRQPSPWLTDLEAALDRMTPGRGVDWRRQLDRARAASRSTPSGRTTSDGAGRGPEPPSALEGTLRRWRSVRSRAARVAPEVILSDDALRAIVAHRPTTPAALAAVPGVGQLKTARFGTELLALLQSTATR
jgi:DNA helicase II / ATP-dependent DNA helicase PcrA